MAIFQFLGDHSYLSIGVWATLILSAFLLFPIWQMSQRKARANQKMAVEHLGLWFRQQIQTVDPTSDSFVELAKMYRVYITSLSRKDDRHTELVEYIKISIRSEEFFATFFLVGSERQVRKAVCSSYDYLARTYDDPNSSVSGAVNVRIAKLISLSLGNRTMRYLSSDLNGDEQAAVRTLLSEARAKRKPDSVPAPTPA